MDERLVLPQNHFKRRVANQYADVLFAIAREVVQNSEDAQATRVDFTVTDDGYHAQDNGRGMTLKEAKEHVLHLGGTSKAGGGSIGVFGAAKEVLILAHDKWTLRSQGFDMSGEGAGNITSKPGGISRGLSIGATSPERDWEWMGDKVRRLAMLSDVRISIYLDGQRVKKGRKLRESQLVKVYEFGKLYAIKSRLRDHETRGRVYVRSGGLYTCSVYIGGPFVFFLELEGSSSETLTESRDYLRTEVRQKVYADVQSIVRKPERLERKPRPKTVKLYGAVSTSVPVSITGTIGEMPGLVAGGSPTSGSHDEMGGLAIDDEAGPALWRRPFLMVDAKSTKMTTAKGNFRPMLKATLEAWHHTVGLICEVAKIDRPMVGLVCHDEIAGCHTLWKGQHVVCVNPSERKLSPYGFMSLVIHELAHMQVGSHCQDYEDARIAIDFAIGENAEMVIHCVRGYLP